MPVVIGTVCAGMLSILAFASKLADAVNVPKRVEVLERGQETLSKRMDGMSFDINSLKNGMESSFAIVKDSMNRAESSRMEGTAIVKAIAQDINDLKRGSMKLEASVTSLQIQQDRFQEMLTDDKKK